ncbi:actin-histidine N-methyltransferase [Condylostylus longicornis]|uniref:actin-histidine N-methyltransferase n=1 Tax=Condylostylus longicornis TaxID=2530218 RepID=UPI00244E55FB|nr:actin-histidine N-methyltransferase [Condylostylus longicornis]XP_055386663.1 actin-histidine N-methyltransferase [Condylostylus longicornis]XP_055386664.1 actin-histidine N-methyltransferase [Condylostylus longicornis]XP_055386665.1 actin-histidine N-methyltransferase [Condylostylus longicornis]XP_055386666.1 actin-histidine N-methyltransferase [Condylostylus longicornis]XP_055386667.1 actin-histidine N-methyltransferase [Condylostylus longicornis]XP_055386669.1 actin-histidine N-methyltr
MGRKNQKKQNNAAKTENAKKLSPQKRNELNSLVESLLKLGFKQANNPTEMWNQYNELQSLLDRVIAIENSVKLKNSSNSNKLRTNKIENFIKWAKENGALFDKVKISEFPGYELGLEATAEIKKGETLITVPRKIMMSELTVPSNKIGTDIPFFDTMANVKLAFILLLEKLDENSFWKPFIDILPEQYSTVMYFNYSEMQELKGSNCFSNALNQCKSIARQYAFIYKCVQTSKEAEILKEKFSYEMYRWAVSTVMTRQNFIPEFSGKNIDENSANAVIPALIPLWDMANHRDGEVTSSYNLDHERLESNALFDFNVGEQIFIYYGNRSNADLLIHNGFIYPDNSADSVSIRLGLGNHDELYKEKTKLLDKLDIANNCELKVLPAPKYISPHLLGFVRVFHMNKDQLDHWVNSERTTDLLHIDCALETSLESKTWQFLQNRLEILLRVFPTTLEADEITFANFKKGQIKLGHIKSMLLHYRILEKKILLNALDYAKQRTKA